MGDPYHNDHHIILRTQFCQDAKLEDKSVAYRKTIAQITQ